METAQPLSGALERCDLFRVLEPQDRAALAARGHRRRFEPGDAIFHAGDPGDSMMAVLAGTVRISLPGQDGREIIIADLAPGEIFGEIALLDGLGRSADASALTRVEVLVIGRRDALAMLSERPEICLRMLALICGKLRASDERTADIAFGDLGARLAKAVLRRAQESRGPRMRVSLSQGELARVVGATREAVNRHIATWQRRGLVELEAGWIVIADRDELASLAGMA